MTKFEISSMNGPLVTRKSKLTKKKKKNQYLATVSDLLLIFNLIDFQEASKHHPALFSRPNKQQQHICALATRQNKRRTLKGGDLS